MKRSYVANDENQSSLKQFKVLGVINKNVLFLSCNGWVSWKDARTYLAEDLVTVNMPKESTAIAWVDEEGIEIGRSTICHS
jgi:hypothetical protein